jgi:hypothetical protein
MKTENHPLLVEHASLPPLPHYRLRWVAAVMAFIYTFVFTGGPLMAQTYDAHRKRMEREERILTVSPAVAETGHPVDVTVEVRNAGFADAVENTLRIWDLGFGISDLEATVPALQPGGSAMLTFHIDDPGEAGVHGLSAIVDAVGAVDESNEQNNTTRFSVKVGSRDLSVAASQVGTVPVRPYPDRPFNNARLESPCASGPMFKIYAATDTAAGEQFVFTNNSTVRALVYAPSASMTFKNNTTFCGAVFAKSATLNQNATVYLDESLWAGVPGLWCE